MNKKQIIKYLLTASLHNNQYKNINKCYYLTTKPKCYEYIILFIRKYMKSPDIIIVGIDGNEKRYLNVKDVINNWLSYVEEDRYELVDVLPNDLVKYLNLL